MAKKERYFVTDEDIAMNEAIFSETEVNDKDYQFDEDTILYEVILTGKKFKIETTTKLVEIK